MLKFQEKHEDVFLFREGEFMILMAEWLWAFQMDILN